MTCDWSDLMGHQVVREAFKKTGSSAYAASVPVLWLRISRTCLGPARNALPRTRTTYVPGIPVCRNTIPQLQNTTVSLVVVHKVHIVPGIHNSCTRYSSDTITWYRWFTTNSIFRMYNGTSLSGCRYYAAEFDTGSTGKRWFASTCAIIIVPRIFHVFHVYLVSYITVCPISTKKKHRRGCSAR